MSENKKILLIEDDSFLQELAAKKLIEGGFEVDVASTGEEGVERVENGEHDLVLLDIILPEMGGFEVLEKIKSHDNENIANKTVVMLSNLGQDEEIQKAKDLGADDYLIKAHFTPEDIVKKVRDYV